MSSEALRPRSDSGRSSPCSPRRCSRPAAAPSATSTATSAADAADLRAPIAAQVADGAAADLDVRRCARHPVLLAGPVREGLQHGRSARSRHRRQRRDDRDRRLVRLAHDRRRPAPVRPVFGVSNPYGIPIDPAIAQDPNLTVIQPAGAVPPFDPTNSDMVGWAQETTLDVEWAHVFAPKANILLVETPVTETEGVTGLPGDRRGRELRDRQPPRERHLAELRRDRADLPDARPCSTCASAFQNAAKQRRHGAGRLGDGARPISC